MTDVRPIDANALLELYTPTDDFVDIHACKVPIPVVIQNILDQPTLGYSPVRHGEWISVEDRLPEDSAEVNLFTRSRIVGSGYYDKYTKRWVQYHAGGAIYADVTHWMPLPEPPKEG